MLILSIALPIILIALMVVGMVVVIEKHEKQVIEEAPRNVILPSSITKAEDFVWFETVMKMAGLENVEVVNTCDCGFATECYMHCNHELNDGKCTGHAYTPWTGRFKAVQKPELMSWQEKQTRDEDLRNVWHRATTVPETEVKAFKQKMIDKRNAKLKSEFEATKKKRGTPSEEMEALRKRIDEREIKLRKYEARLERLAKAVTPPQPQYISQPTAYDPVLDCYTVYGKKISRHMLEDLIYNGGLTREQLKEILAPEYDTLEAVYEFGKAEPVMYLETPPDTSWIRTERV